MTGAEELKAIRVRNRRNLVGVTIDNPPPIEVTDVCDLLRLLDAERAKREEMTEIAVNNAAKLHAALAEVERLTAESEKMREALIEAELAINPRDRKMLSIAVWQDRLKAATDKIFTALNQPNPWMPGGKFIEGASK